MADLQDELNALPEAGELQDRAQTAPFAPQPPPRADRSPRGPHGGQRNEPESGPLERARALLAAHPVVDGHSGLPWALRDLPWYDLRLGESGVETDVLRLREDHVAALLWSLHLPEALAGDRAVGATLEQLDLVRSVIAEHPEGLRLARSAGHVIDARNCGRVAVVLGPADAAALDDSLGILRVLHSLGLRVLTLAGASWAGEAGLTRFGEEVVREMNRIGVLADLSGASDATIGRALALSKTPVLCTRSGARALRAHRDNLSDALLAELGAAKGLCLVPLSAERTGPTVQDVADHLDHVRALAGPECVGLSGAHDPGAQDPGSRAGDAYVPGAAPGYPHLVAELLTRGWPETDVALLTWGNMQRVLRSADFAARAARERRKPSTARITDLDATAD
jgi:microsomal dipeptidase-like Zn-dependent dipeptidase